MEKSMNQEQNRLKSLFESAVKANLPESSIVLDDETRFYGRVLSVDNKNITLIGMKHKRYRIYTREIGE